MTPEYVQKQVAAIADMANDDEAAHAKEDELHQAVLRSIANSTCVDPVSCAKIALTTDEIAFARWCA